LIGEVSDSLSIARSMGARAKLMLKSRQGAHHGRGEAHRQQHRQAASTNQSDNGSLGESSAISALGPCCRES
jgi:hypothetical protein